MAVDVVADGDNELLQVLKSGAPDAALGQLIERRSIMFDSDAEVGVRCTRDGHSRR
jgi:hypothetical protein